MTMHGPIHFSRYGKSWLTKKYFNSKFSSTSSSHCTNTMASFREGPIIRIAILEVNKDLHRTEPRKAPSSRLTMATVSDTDEARC